MLRTHDTAFSTFKEAHRAPQGTTGRFRIASRMLETAGVHLRLIAVDSEIGVVSATIGWSNSAARPLRRSVLR